MDEDDIGAGKATPGGGRGQVRETDGGGQAADLPGSDDPWAANEVDSADLDEVELTIKFNEFHDRADRLGLSGGMDSGYEPAGNARPEAAGGRVLNRNLSASVDEIRDDGPVIADGVAHRSAPHAVRETEYHPAYTASTPPSSRTPGVPEPGGGGYWHGVMTVLAGMAGALAPGRAGYWRLLGISSVIVVLIGFTFWGKGQLSGDRQAVILNQAPEIRLDDEPVATPPAAAELEQLRLRQQELIVRQDLLLRDITEMKQAITARPGFDETALASELEQQRLQLISISETVSGLQSRISGLELPVSGLPAPAAGPKRTDKAGGWSVTLASFADEKAANARLVELRKAGIKAEPHPVTVDGATRFRLRVTGFASRAEALQYASTLASDHGISDAWTGPD